MTKSLRDETVPELNANMAVFRSSADSIISDYDVHEVTWRIGSGLNSTQAKRQIDSKTSIET